MKQLGNLAIVCAKRRDVRLRIKDGQVSVLVDNANAKQAYFAAWDDDATISRIIHELNFGQYAPKQTYMEGA